MHSQNHSLIEVGRDLWVRLVQSLFKLEHSELVAQVQFSQNSFATQASKKKRGGGGGGTSSLDFMSYKSIEFVIWVLTDGI